jgi:hypothetical protein
LCLSDAGFDPISRASTSISACGTASGSKTPRLNSGIEIDEPFSLWGVLLIRTAWHGHAGRASAAHPDEVRERSVPYVDQQFWGKFRFSNRNTGGAADPRSRSR